MKFFAQCAWLAVWLLAGLRLASAAPLPMADDPLQAPGWPEVRRAVLGEVPVVFDERVRVQVPALAEDPLQVPLTVDASALGRVREVRVFADLNPIVGILSFYPEAAPARLGFRIKLQQSTPVRAAALDEAGVWHVGGQWVATTGGGCTAPSLGTASPEWQRRLNEVSGRRWAATADGAASRLRLRIVHPMDTGLVAGIPAFHLEQLDFHDAAGVLLMRIRLHEPVSENPVFTLGGSEGPVRVSGRDNNGNRVEAQIR